MNITFELDQEADTVASGGTLTGDLILRVTKPVRATSMSVQLEGKEHTTVQSQKDITRGATYRKRVRKEAHGSHRIINTHLVVPGLKEVIKNGKIAAGKYEFPFDFDLPLKLPPTLAVQQDGNTAAIAYRLRATVKGADEYEIFHPIRVLADQEPLENVPTIVTPREQKLKTKWFGNGKIFFGAKLMDTQFVRGSRPQVKTAIVNDSDVKVVGLKMTLKQVVEFAANEHRASITENLLSITFPYKEMPKNQERSKSKQNREKVSQVLQSCDGVQQDCWSLPSIPERTLNTMDGGSVWIRHAIVITIQTGTSCSMNPKFEVPIKVLNGEPLPPPPPQREKRPSLRPIKKRRSRRPSTPSPVSKNKIEVSPVLLEKSSRSASKRRSSRRSSTPYTVIDLGHDDSIRSESKRRSSRRPSTPSNVIDLEHNNFMRSESKRRSSRRLSTPSLIDSSEREESSTYLDSKPKKSPLLDPMSVPSPKDRRKRRMSSFLSGKVHASNREPSTVFIA